MYGQMNHWALTRRVKDGVSGKAIIHEYVS